MPEYVFRARLTPEQGARVVQAIASATDEEFQERRDVSAETPNRPAIPPASEPVAQRRADALERLADAFLGDSPTVTGGDRCTINLHTTPDTLSEHGETADSELGGSTSTAGARVSAETCSR